MTLETTHLPLWNNEQLYPTFLTTDVILSDAFHKSPFLPPYIGST